MRIIAGRLGGRTFQSPHGHRTHPMSDKARGALFNALGDIAGLTVLDAFAGSGALGFEAISRGATSVVAVEADKLAHHSIQENIRKLKIGESVKATKAFVAAWSNRSQARLFDLVLADPPFDDIPYRDLKSLPRHVAAGGTLVLSWPGHIDALKFKGVTQIAIKNYGDNQLVFYRKLS